MTYRSSGTNQFRTLMLGDAHRAYLIGGMPPSRIYHSGKAPLRRVSLLARFARNHVRGLFAAIRVALVADKMRRAEQELAFRRVAADPAPKAGPERARS